MDLIILFSKFSKKCKNWIKCVNEVYSFLINNGSNLLKKKKSMVLYNNIWNIFIWVISYILISSSQKKKKVILLSLSLSLLI